MNRDAAVARQSAYAHRFEAGDVLAARLRGYANRDDVVVLGLPRGGVPVAAIISHALNVPLDVFIVRKLAVPGQPELAMGAIASGGIRVLSPEIIAALHIPSIAVDAAISEEGRELQRRERLYRNGRPPLPLSGRTVILVDDGLATGSTMRAAVEAVRMTGPARIVVAVPVGSPEACRSLAALADQVVCPLIPASLHCIGRWYYDFPQTSDDQVRALLGLPAAALAAEGV
jgi:predicted phosphoribosyltransferase